MSLLFFIIPPDSTLLIERGGYWLPIHGAASMGLPIHPGEPIRLQIIESDDKHQPIVSDLAVGDWHQFKLLFVDGSQRLFRAALAHTITEGNAHTTTLEAEPSTQGVVANFHPLVGTVSRRIARDLPEIGAAA